MIYLKGDLDLFDSGVAAGQGLTAGYGRNPYDKLSEENNLAWDWVGAVDDMENGWDLRRTLADGGGWPNWHPQAELRRGRGGSSAGR